jgi:hypothetical protein
MGVAAERCHYAVGASVYLLPEPFTVRRTAWSVPQVRGSELVQERVPDGVDISIVQVHSGSRFLEKP